MKLSCSVTWWSEGGYWRLDSPLLYLRGWQLHSSLVRTFGWRPTDFQTAEKSNGDEATTSMHL
ncbi:hypothetical protein PGT21_004599 [Puccinia graminis f. sp. tritici]|uniref:Uncharacterized protein n=1 Tax=Puccinia graminis f. sp. tritici TaxID=56615 RepID=A0A5B0LUQ3_PUCGR|nr:hypothetical protein PGT21_004599 [Puccinia graminis f. sp. tritici]